MLTKKLYEQTTGRSQKSNVIAYQIRQSFRPGEITAEDANRIGYELASRFLKGKHAFIVATHTDREHIYIELINPLGAIVERIQLKARRRLFFGHIALSDTLPDGDYTLRAYTDYMANTTKDYLFKRKIKIISPKWGNVKMKVTTKGTTPNSSQLIFQFNHNDSLFSVHHLEAILKKGKSHIPERQKRKDQFEVEFTEKVMETNRSFRLRLTDRLDNKYERFLPIATDKEQYNVFFYPEGGSLVNGVSNRDFEINTAR